MRGGGGSLSGVSLLSGGGGPREVPDKEEAKGICLGFVGMRWAVKLGRVGSEEWEAGAGVGFLVEALRSGKAGGGLNVEMVRQIQGARAY